MGQSALAFPLNVGDVVEEKAVRHIGGCAVSFDPGVEKEERLGGRVFEQVAY